MKKKNRRVATGLMRWLFPDVQKSSYEGINQVNIQLIRKVSPLFLGFTIVLLVLYGGYYVLHGSWHSLALNSLVICVSIFVFVFVISGRWGKDPFAASRKSTAWMMELFYWLFSVWGIVVSWRMYLRGNQMMIMDTVQIGFMLLVCCYPAWGIIRILVSYIALFLLLFQADGSAQINFAVYGMMIFMTCFGVVLRYGMELRNIEMVRDLNRYTQNLQHRSSHDELTGMKNRVALRVDFPNYCRKNVWVVMCDVDHFKRYNDTYGHAVGDEILQTFAEKITDFFGEASTYRYGGDEFLMILEGDSQSEIGSLLMIWADAIRRIRLDTLPEEDDFSCSYGYEEGTPADEQALRRMVVLADEKLYQMKKSRSR